MNLREREYVLQYVNAAQKGTDRQFIIRMVIQIVEGIFSPVNKYYTAEHDLTPEERATYRTLDSHPDAIGLLIFHWVRTGAAQRFEKEYPWETFDSGKFDSDLSTLLH